ncbi:sugar phosphate isomerase/epimerase family protein [Planctomicrobium sp. SH664]|uniref:sugar phosphate isomerase/epimerase family protein n=1 Tax=Planctomicrobium sp. SH664 TaxID=3448125 RepID=UPI003F5B4A4A
MQLGMINSAWSQAGRDTAWGIAKTRELGFDSIDIAVDPLEIGVRERRLIKQECDRQGLPIVSLCCVSVGLIDFNPSIVEFHMHRTRAHLDLVYEYEAKNLLLVLGEYIWNREIIPPEQQWKTGVESCRKLAEYAETLGIQIALELEPFHLSLLNNVDNMVRFVDDVGHPALQANIDISHLHLARVPPEDLRKLKGKAIHVHISDCDGVKHGDLPPGRGVVNFEPYLREIRDLDIDGAISLELEYSPDPARIEDWVREARDATASLMVATGLRS